MHVHVLTMTDSHCDCTGMFITLPAATWDHAPGAAPQSTYPSTQKVQKRKT